MNDPGICNIWGSCGELVNSSSWVSYARNLYFLYVFSFWARSVIGDFSLHLAHWKCVSSQQFKWGAAWLTVLEGPLELAPARRLKWGVDYVCHLHPAKEGTWREEDGGGRDL